MIVLEDGKSHLLNINSCLLLLLDSFDCGCKVQSRLSGAIRQNDYYLEFFFMTHRREIIYYLETQFNKKIKNKKWLETI